MKWYNKITNYIITILFVVGFLSGASIVIPLISGFVVAFGEMALYYSRLSWFVKAPISIAIVISYILYQNERWKKVSWKTISDILHTDFKLFK